MQKKEKCKKKLNLKNVYAKKKSKILFKKKQAKKAEMQKKGCKKAFFQKRLIFQKKIMKNHEFSKIFFTFGMSSSSLIRIKH